MYGHADLLATLGRCADDPTCTRVAVVQDDTDPTVRRCGQHAIARLTAQDPEPVA